MAWPWISRELHEAQMTVLEHRNQVLTRDLARSESELARRKALLHRSVVALRKAEARLTLQPSEAPQPAERVPPKTLDLAEVDPNDRAAVRDLALAEMPRGKINATLLMHKMESIRTQIHAAAAARSVRSMEVGPAPPEWVNQAIDAAIEQGAQRAQGR